MESSVVESPVVRGIDGGAGVDTPVVEAPVVASEVASADVELAGLGDPWQS